MYFQNDTMATITTLDKAGRRRELAVPGAPREAGATRERRIMTMMCLRQGLDIRRQGFRLLNKVATNVVTLENMTNILPFFTPTYLP